MYIVSAFYNMCEFQFLYFIQTHMITVFLLLPIIRVSIPIVFMGIRILLDEVVGMKYASDWFAKVFTDLQTEKNILVSNRDLIRVKVEATDHKTEKVNNSVFEWLKESDILIQEVKNLTVQARTRQWNEFRKLLKKLTAMNIKCDFDPFSTPIPSLEHFSSGNIVCFKSTEKASDEILEALQDDNCSIIGLYGRQGSGKTTLMKAMREKVKYLNIFYEVLLVTMNQSPNIRTIQDEIGDSLNIIFDKNTEVGRAKILSSTLENMDRPILVIFDDVRAKFELGDVGIPCNSNRCKILLTTRCQQDSDFMHCQMEIQLDPVSILEAWTLFKKHSGIHDEENSSSLKLLNVAREIVSECDGLPGKILKVGRSLRSKPIEEWRALLDGLRHSMARWQIFLSFRGEDTRYSFTGFLYDALCREGFKTFMDEEGLKPGDEISSSIINAIEASMISIVVLSKNFAYSPWCLDELVTILKCKKMKNQLIWPIFYKVETSDVRHQKNSYGKALAKHEKRFGNDSEKVNKWRSALFEVAGLSGLTHKTGYEYKLIQKIVEMANNIKNRLYIQSMYMD